MATKAAADEMEEVDEDEPETLPADVYQKAKGWLLRVPNDLAEEWNQRRRTCELYRAKQKELAQNPKAHGLEEEVRRLKRKAEEDAALGTIELEETKTKRGTESVGTFKDASGRPWPGKIESEGAFFTAAPHLRILTETHVFDRDGDISKKLKVAAAVKGHFVFKKSVAGAASSILMSKQVSKPEILEDEGAVGFRPLQQREINARQARVDSSRLQRTEARTERRDLDDVRNHLFDLFREGRHWTLKDLRERTQQPEAHLKVILADLCDFENFGENKGKYQLKEEFRTE